MHGLTPPELGRVAPASIWRAGFDEGVVPALSQVPGVSVWSWLARRVAVGGDLRGGGGLQVGGQGGVADRVQAGPQVPAGAVGVRGEGQGAIAVAITSAWGRDTAPDRIASATAGNPVRRVVARRTSFAASHGAIRCAERSHARVVGQPRRLASPRESTSPIVSSSSAST
jgi:hypothetical protein